MADGEAYLTKSEAKAVLGPMLTVALNAATVAVTGPQADAEERKRVWDDFSAHVSQLIETLRRLDLLDGDQSAGWASTSGTVNR